jgi:hypothetical protein
MIVFVVAVEVIRCSVNVLTYTGSLTTETLSIALQRHISNIKRHIYTFVNASARGIRLEARHFVPNALLVPDIVTCFYDIDAMDEAEPSFIQLRKVYHQVYQLPVDRPMLRRSFSLPLFDKSIGATSDVTMAKKQRLSNVHNTVKRPSGVKGINLNPQLFRHAGTRVLMYFFYFALIRDAPYGPRDL